jgi:hypothetical protein
VSHSRFGSPLMRLASTSKLRRLATSACVICAASIGVAGASLPAANGAPSASGASTQRCASSGLVVWLDTQGNGTAGSIYYQLQLTNLSGRTCTLRGYPGVSAVGLSGRQLGRAASREGGRSPSTVTLANGATARATLRIVVAGAFPSSSCRLTTAAGLRVYPPDQSTSRMVPFPFEACAHSGPTVLSVGPVRRYP